MAAYCIDARLTAIDLFAGAGGLSEGFRQAGFEVLAANDFDDAAAATFRLNHPDTKFLEGPIGNIGTEVFLETGRLEEGELTVLVGGPPCQAFSVYNHQRGMHDERSGLFREYLRLVGGLSPRFVVMENVTGITSVDEGQAVGEIYKRLNKLGYYVEHRILKAEEYGVPQERRRIFIVGSRDTKKIEWPEPTHTAAEEGTLFFDGKGRLPRVTVWEAIGDLPPLGITEGNEESDYSAPPQSEYQRLIRKGSRKLYNHVAPFLADINLRRLKHIPQGGSWRDIPHSLLPAGMKKARRCDHTKRYGRLAPDGLASTILTKCDLHWGAFIHPTQERCLTVREAARLQSFPDVIRFAGSRGDQFRQVGNAVPPLLGRAVARKIKAMLESVGIDAKKGPSPLIDPLTVIAEVLGQPADQMRNPVNADYQCPFINSRCVKRSHSGHRGDEPYPVCSVWRQERIFCTCPKRFFEIELVKDVLEKCWVNDAPPADPRLAHEVQMKGFGNIDLVIAELFADGGIKDFVSVELQAMDFSGSVYPAYEALLNSTQLARRPTFGPNWANVRKRYVEQLIKKGIYHHHWNSRMISVIQSPFFDYLAENLRFDQLECKSESANITFMVYDFELDNSNGTLRHTLKLQKVLGTSHSSLMMSALYRPAPPRDQFCRKIEGRLSRA